MQETAVVEQTTEQPNISSDVTTPEASTDKKPPLSPQFAAMARKQKEIRRRETELSEKQKAFEAREAQYRTDYVPRSQLTEDPLSVLTEAGYTPDKIAEMLLNQSGNQDPTITEIKRELAKLRSAQEKSEAAQSEAQKRQTDAALGQIRKEVAMYVDGNEEFETITAMGQQEAVIELMQATFDEEGYLPTIESAAKEVEEYLLEQALKYSDLKKVQAKRTPPPVTAEKQETPPSKQGATTLTNRTVSSATRPLTVKERMERAIAVAEGRLQPQ